MILTRVLDVNSESVAVNSSSYVPGAVKVTFVRAAFGFENVAVPGPDSIFQPTTNALPRGSPSSFALPNRLNSSPSVAFNMGGCPRRAVTPSTRTCGARFRQTPRGALATSIFPSSAAPSTRFQFDCSMCSLVPVVVPA